MRIPQLLAAALCAAVTLAASAATPFPSGPVKLVHGLPGGLVDVGARVLAEELAATWKQPVVVDSKPGAGEMLAADAVARGPRDGSSLLVATEAVLVNHQLLFRKPVVDVQKELVPVCDLFEVPFALVVRSGLDVNSVPEFVALMRKEGNKHFYASSGPGSPLQIAMEDFARIAGFRMEHVPYKTLGQLTTDLLGGAIDAVFLSVPSSQAFVKSGKLKMLAVTGDTRAQAAPQVPTFAELGYRGVDYSTVVTLAAPQGTPAPVLAQIERDVRGARQSSAFTQRFLVPQDLKPATACGAALSERLAARRAATQRTLQNLHIQLD